MAREHEIHFSITVCLYFIESKVFPAPNIVINRWFYYRSSRIPRTDPDRWFSDCRIVYESHPRDESPRDTRISKVSPLLLYRARARTFSYAAVTRGRVLLIAGWGIVCRSWDRKPWAIANAHVFPAMALSFERPHAQFPFLDSYLYEYVSKRGKRSIKDYIICCSKLQDA